MKAIHEDIEKNIKYIEEKDEYNVNALQSLFYLKQQIEGMSCNSCKLQRTVECPIEELREVVNEEEWANQMPYEEIELEIKMQTLTLGESFFCNNWEKK